MKIIYYYIITRRWKTNLIFVLFFSAREHLSTFFIYENSVNGRFIRLGKIAIWSEHN